MTAPRLLLSEPLPLRTTRMLGDYAVDEPLPEIIGNLTDGDFPLIRLSAVRYFAADHPMQIARVFVARQNVLAWKAELQSDADGNTWTTVVFESPVDKGAAVSATGTGRLDPVNGALIENPADVLTRICAIAGRSDRWDALRAECSSLNLTVAGRIASAQSIRAQIDAITKSIGAIWVPGMARLYPTTADPSPVFDLDAAEVSAIQVSASIVDTADVLRLSYDVSDARNAPLHYMELSARPQRYNGVIVEQTAAWLRTPQAAETVGRALLRRLAGERYDVHFATTRRSVRPGDWVRLVANAGWPLAGADPVVMVLAVDITDKNRADVDVVAEYLAAPMPMVSVSAFSIALPDEVAASLEVSVVNGVATFTATDDNGTPIAGARVTLDGSVARTTDAQGRVSFVIEQSAQGRAHTVLFEAPGFEPQTIAIEL
jgi:hypothetical protein